MRKPYMIVGVCVIGMLTMLLITSCAVFGTHLTGNWGQNCAWCKTRVGRHYDVDYVCGYGTYDVWRGYSHSGVLLGKVNTEEAAEKLIQEDLRSETYSYRGFSFCSLRCLNAYKASEDIKETRIRVIPHE